MVGINDIEPVLRRSGWPSSYGFGINAVTGRASGKPAVTQLFPYRKHETSPVQDEVHVVRGAEDAKRVLGYAAADTLNVNPANWDEHHAPNASLLPILASSRTSFSVVLSCHRFRDSVRDCDQPRLTDDARRVLAADPARFRALYGHYYVHGLRRVDGVTAVLTFAFQSLEECDGFAASVQRLAQQTSWRGKAAEVLARTLHSGLANLARAYIVERTAAAYVLGASAEEVLATVAEAMDRFRRETTWTAPASPAHFLLLHPYDSLPGFGLREVISAAPFREIGAIRDALVRTRLLLNALPFPKWEMVENLFKRWNAFDEDVARRQAELPALPQAERMRLLLGLRELEGEARNLDAVHAFWLYARAARESEPAVDKAHYASRTFGLVPTDSTPLVRVTVGVYKKVTVLPRCIAATRCSAVDLGRGNDGYVVGWRVRLLKGRGRWMKTKRGDIITGRGGVVALERDMMRKSRWEVATFVVRDNRAFEELCYLEKYGNFP